MNTNMTDEHIVKTFLSYSIPCIVGMLLTSFIIVVDGVFIGYQIGENGLAAINLTLPVMYILLAVTILIGVGGVTLAAQSLGAEKKEEAGYYFSFSLGAILLVDAIIIGILRLFFADVVVLLGAAGDVYGYVTDFFGVILYFYIFMMINMAFSMFIRAEGKPQLSLFFGLAGNILNVILDYVFIIKLDWGMCGAALASGIAVLLPFLFGVWYFLSKKSAFTLSAFSINLAVFKSMLLLGLAEFIAQISISITTYIFNQVLFASLGVNGIAAFTVIGYVMFVESMILTGIAVGIHPLISFHFGAKNISFIFSMFKTAAGAAFTLGVLIFAAVFALSENIVGLFARDNQALIHIGSIGLKFFSAAFIINGYNMMAAAFFTSIGEAKKAVLVSSLRSLILIIGFLAVLPGIIGDAGIWLSTPLAEAVTFGIAYLMIIKSKMRLMGNETRATVKQ